MPDVPVGSRRCSNCGKTKPLTEFAIKNKKTGVRRSWCRDCQRAYSREHYARNKPAYLSRAQRHRRDERPKTRAAILAYLREHPCVDCGETNVLFLDFDHRDGTTKREAVSRLALSTTVAVVMAEIAKCDVRCANCHRKRTAAQFNWRKDPTFTNDRRATLPLPRRPARASATGQPVVEQLSVWSVGVTKRCGRCKQDKPLHEFAFHDRKLGKRQHHCRSCQAELRRQHYADNREHYMAWAMRQQRERRDTQVALVHDYLRTHPCVDCGETDLRLLEFDHIDGAVKVMPISVMMGRRNTKVLMEEIAKCEVRCVNCHRRRTAETFRWAKRLGEDTVGYNFRSPAGVL